MRRTAPQVATSVEVFDTPSGLGGSHTVSIVERLAEGLVKVRVWYGRAGACGWERWPDWDGYQFTTKESALRNPHLLQLRRGA
jgi:hypothetical protein